MIKTNLGEIPNEDCLDMLAIQYGFDSYEDMKNQGYDINNNED